MNAEEFYEKRHGDNYAIGFGAKAMILFAEAYAKQENEKLKEYIRTNCSDTIGKRQILKNK